MLPYSSFLAAKLKQAAFIMLIINITEHKNPNPTPFSFKLSEGNVQNMHVIFSSFCTIWVTFH